MRTQNRLSVLGAVCAALLGCAASPIEPTPGFSHIDSRALVYDELVVDIVVASDIAPMEVKAETSGDGAREGVKMMLQAPLGCLQAGPMFAAVCLGLAPFFPLMAANDVQDAEKSRAELETMAERIDRAAIERRFRESIEAHARDAGLPLVESPSPGARVATLHAELGQTQLEHDGTESGQITLTQPYRFSLSYGDRAPDTLIEGKRWDRLYIRNGPRKNAAKLAEDFERWTSETAELGLRDSLIEWQPKVVLGPVAPALFERRNIIGIKQTRRPFVESTTPRLAWQSLEEVLEPSVLADVSDISYELELFPPREGRRVTGLTTPEYVIAEPLNPCAYYYWRPTARFRYRGVVHTTSPNMSRWSKTEYVINDYSFNTPAPDCKEPRWVDQ